MHSSDLLNDHDWGFPVPIAYGPGRLRQIAEICQQAGTKHPLIVTDKGSRDLPFIADVSKYLTHAGLTFGLYADISPNPNDSEISAGRAQYRSGQHDGIIAIGGGSGMDGAKAICLVANNDHDLWAFEYSKPPVDMTSGKPFPPLICVPTTAGTGAETESTAMINETARKMKLCVWHPDLKPRIAVLDPEITVGLPKSLTAWTGCDAMVHAIEAYCVPDFHPMCDGAALEALRLITRHLPRVVANPQDLQARGGMLVGSCLAGVSFLKGLGLVHAISHMIGAEFNTHHGLTNAIILPSVLKFNAPTIAPLIPVMCDAMGLKDKSFDGFYQNICKTLDVLEIPRTLADINVPIDCAAAIAKKAILDSAAATNPRDASIEEIQGIIETAISHGR